MAIHPQDLGQVMALFLKFLLLNLGRSMALYQFCVREVI